MTKLLNKVCDMIMVIIIMTIVIMMIIQWSLLGVDGSSDINKIWIRMLKMVIRAIYRLMVMLPPSPLCIGFESADIDMPKSQGLKLTIIGLNLTSLKLNLTIIGLNLTSLRLNVTIIGLNLTILRLNLTSLRLNLISLGDNLTSLGFITASLQASSWPR